MIREIVGPKNVLHDKYTIPAPPVKMKYDANNQIKMNTCTIKFTFLNGRRKLRRVITLKLKSFTLFRPSLRALIRYISNSCESWC
jgi:hypothetical protein